MERHTCKLCHRRFPNGRSLGGHMRSHVTAAAAAAAASPARPPVMLLPASSASSASTSEDGGKGSGQSYGLRENPKKSFRLVDPEFSSGGGNAAAAAVLQDRESETESPRAAGPPPVHRRRSKRPRPSPIHPPPPQADPEPVSSVSDATPVEDVAISLMLLSRDVWTRSSSVDGEQQMQSDEATYVSDRADQIAGGSRGLYVADDDDEKKRIKFQCDTCKRMFKSYQALGGHRASHKKLKQSCARTPDQSIVPSDANAGKVHECPICSRVFGSGQALGGHKRSHLYYATAVTTVTTSASSPSIPPQPIPQVKSLMIDLNLPAPTEDEAAELSVVSEAEFLASQHHPQH